MRSAENRKSAWTMAVAAAGLAVFAYFAWSTHRTTQELEASLAKTKDEIQATAGKQAQSSAIGLQNNNLRSQILSIFTSELETVAMASQTKISQIQIDGTTQPLQPSQGTEQSDPELARQWGLSEVSFVLEGPTPQVYAALQRIQQLETPFRIVEVGINRMVSQQNSSSSQGVSATVKVAILARKEGLS